MSYLFLLRRGVDRRTLAEALAEFLSLPVTAVDVGGNDEDDRDWAAPVSCTVTHLDGDLPLHLDVYFTGGSSSPAEVDAAAWLANRLGTVVGYKSVPLPPSAYWLVGPDGRRTRARLADEDEAGNLLPSGLRVAAVEIPVALLPDVPVAAVPEVIREYRVPTPLSDQLKSLADNAATRRAVDRLAGWEGMVARLAANWPPDGWYPPGYYREGLELRDRLAAIEQELPEPMRTTFGKALSQVDRRFTAATIDDGGRALASTTGPIPDRWWWHRVPQPLPWQKMPGPRIVNPLTD